MIDAELDVHVGFPKAASTFLQVNVFPFVANREFVGIVRDHDALKEAHRPRVKPEAIEFSRYVRGLENDLDKAKRLLNLANGSEKRVLLSEEDFSVVDAGAGVDRVERLSRLAPKSRILVVVRHPYEIVRSFHAFYVRGNKVHSSLNDFITNELRNPSGSLVLNTARVGRTLDAFIAAFGESNVRCVDFGSIKVSQSSFVDAVCAALELDLPLGFVEESRNIALPSSALAIARRTPALWRTRFLLPQSARRAAKSVLGLVPSKREELSSESKKILEDLYTEDISSVKKMLAVNW